MTDELQNRRDEIIEAMLGHVVFDGWSKAALAQGAIDAGYTEDMAERAFPNGINAAIDHFADWSDRRMLKALKSQDLQAMKVRDRIHACVKTRIQ